MAMRDASSIAIHLFGDADLAAVRSVAERDSRPVPEGALLVAEVDGEVAAALSLATGEVVADPFRPTSAVVDMLRLRARQLRPHWLRGPAGKPR
jgi:hypothetical protein